MILRLDKGIVIKKHVRNWCRLSYPDHPNGCPNYNKSAICPPKIGMLDQYFNLHFYSWFIIEKFNLKEHAERLLKMHPDWSSKQCRCCLYWQGKARKNLKIKTLDFMKNHKDTGLAFTTCPEAMGVNVFATCARHKFYLKKNIKEFVYKINFVGYKNNLITKVY